MSELTQREALEAIVNGKVIISDNYKYWFSGDTLMGQEGSDEPFDASGVFLFDKTFKWKLYEEPKKSLTFKEALECEKVRVRWPEVVSPSFFGHENSIYSKVNGYHDVSALKSFDLAERRGYHMEAVD